MNREQKAQVVEEVAGEIRESGAIIAVDYRGISVPQVADLRARLGEADAHFRVVKNRLTIRAADAAGAESLKDLLVGPTALTFIRGDAAVAAKAITRFQRDEDVLEIKGGIIDGETLSIDQIKEIARLPSRDQLHAQVVGVLASPITGLVRGLGSMVQGLAMQLGQIRDQGLVSGEAPAEEAPAEEAPADEAEEAPAEEAPAEEAPAAEEPAAEAEEAPADTTDEAQTEEAPEGDTPAEEAPGDPVAEAETAADETSEDPPSEGEDKEG